MAVKVVMPKLGMAMKQGEVSIWNKKVGDPVEKGESIASIQSEKIEMEIEAPEKGTLIDIKVKEGEEVRPAQRSAISGTLMSRCRKRRVRLLLKTICGKPFSPSNKKTNPQPPKKIE